MMKPKVGRIVAIRKFREVGPRHKDVKVVIGKPRKRREGEWACPYYISGVGMERIRYVYGVDAFQALLLAFQGIRISLEKTGKRFSWIGGEEGDTGLPRFVPDCFGLKFSNRLERLIDREVERFTRQLEKKHQRKSRAQRSLPGGSVEGEAGNK